MLLASPTGLDVAIRVTREKYHEFHSFVRPWVEPRGKEQGKDCKEGKKNRSELHATIIIAVLARPSQSPGVWPQPPGNETGRSFRWLPCVKMWTLCHSAGARNQARCHSFYDDGTVEKIRACSPSPGSICVCPPCGNISGETGSRRALEGDQMEKALSSYISSPFTAGLSFFQIFLQGIAPERHRLYGRHGFEFLIFQNGIARPFGCCPEFGRRGG